METKSPKSNKAAIQQAVDFCLENPGEKPVTGARADFEIDSLLRKKGTRKGYLVTHICTQEEQDELHGVGYAQAENEKN
jgi:hypothetical protein